ncbi:hypothetical protein HT136_23195 [Novosphingobium profundi]|uniref:hypothetical protein n=1 Tax=Novosphingobium profundi TaxID=1774954 RepID=UPI001BD9BFDC|nr:hypothetical protein [Novosphingobium profundi]MBT0671281.1 hypothetical protein [Novosphingobium profundi]
MKCMKFAKLPQFHVEEYVDGEWAQVTTLMTLLDAERKFRQRLAKSGGDLRVAHGSTGDIPFSSMRVGNVLDLKPS